MIGECFRYESCNMRDLRRLWDFSMRELVVLGERDTILAERSRGIEAFQEFLEEHRLAGESTRKRSLLRRAPLGGEDVLPDQLRDEVRDVDPPAGRRKAGAGVVQPPWRLLRQEFSRVALRRRADAQRFVAPGIATMPITHLDALGFRHAVGGSTFSRQSAREGRPARPLSPSRRGLTSTSRRGRLPSCVL